MTMFDKCTMSQLFALWVENWRVAANALNEVIGEDETPPDPRQIAKELSEMPEEVWIGLFQSEGFRDHMNKTMMLQRVMAQVQMENVEIIETALDQTQNEEMS